MNRDMLESQWIQVRGILKEKFPNLTEEDIRQINGRYDQLVAKLQQKYGYTQEEAEERIKNWNFDRLSAADTGKVYRENYRNESDRVSKTEETSEIYKWLLGLGIPLLLIAAYWAYNTPQTTTPMVTNQQMAETATDRTMSDGLRRMFLSQSDVPTLSLQNIQLTSHNGVVTLNGNVPDRATFNYVDTTVKDYPGVRQVINNLQIR